MQAIPDYTQQLNRIAEVLNRPSTPQWVFVFLGALITFLIHVALKGV